MNDLDLEDLNATIQACTKISECSDVLRTVEPRCPEEQQHAQNQDHFGKMTKLWSKMKPAEKFEVMWFEHGYESSDFCKEYRFSDNRKFRLDYAFPSMRIGVEIHGFGYGHQAQQHLATDCEKIREAIKCNWLVIPFTTRCISSRENCQDAVDFVCHILSLRHGRLELNESP